MPGSETVALRVTIHDAPRSPAWDALWQRLLASPKEEAARPDGTGHGGESSENVNPSIPQELAVRRGRV